MKIKILLFLLIAFTLLLCSCETPEGVDKNKKYPTVNLNVYNWGEYISDEDDEECGLFDVNAGFEEYFNTTLADQYGFYVKVNYSTYANNEDMYAKLSNSAVSYDIVVPSDYMIQKMIKDEMLLPLDMSLITNYDNISDSFKNLYYDYDEKNPENIYSIPYTYGMVGIIYNSAYVKDEDVADKTWNLLWNQNKNGDELGYKGKILQFNNPRDAFATAMFKVGIDINSHDYTDWEKALELLIEQKPLLQGYVNDEIFNKMKGGSAYIAPYFAGDFLTMAADNNDLRFYYPSEGTNYFVDAFCIPKTSKNPEVAHEYINYMIGLEAARANALYIGYASPNAAVVEDPTYIELLDFNYSIYASDEEDAECLIDAYEILYGKTKEDYEEIYPFNPAYENYYKSEDGTVDVQQHVNKLWEDLKISIQTELWIHVTSIAIVVSVLGFAIYSSYIRKKRSKFYRDRDKALRKQRQINK